MIPSFLLILSLFCGGLLYATPDNLTRLELTHEPLSDPFIERLTQHFDISAIIRVDSSDYIDRKSTKPVYLINSSEAQVEKYKKSLRRASHLNLFKGNLAAFLKQDPAHLKGTLLLIFDGRVCDETFLSQLDKSQRFVILVDHFSSLKNKNLKNALSLIDPRMTFFVLDDLAISYIADESTTVSPLTLSYTASYLEESDPSNIIEAESVIIREGAIAAGLKQSISPHVLLWKGLALLGQKDYFEASRCFHEAKALGYDHWRVYWYISLAEYERRNFAEAKRALNLVVKEAPSFQPAHDLLIKIDSPADRLFAPAD